MTAAQAVALILYVIPILPVASQWSDHVSDARDDLREFGPLAPQCAPAVVAVMALLWPVVFLADAVGWGRR